MSLASTWRTLALLWWFSHLRELFEISIGWSEREWKKMKFGLCGEWFGQEMSEIWQKQELGMRVCEKMRSCSFQILKSKYIGAGMHCNQLQHLVIDYTIVIIDYQRAFQPKLNAEWLLREKGFEWKSKYLLKLNIFDIKFWKHFMKES